MYDTKYRKTNTIINMHQTFLYCCPSDEVDDDDDVDQKLYIWCGDGS